MNIGYIFFHLGGIVEKAIIEDDKVKLNEIANELRKLTESIDTHYCLKLDTDGNS